MGLANWIVCHLRGFFGPGRRDLPAKRYSDSRENAAEADPERGQEPFPQKAMLDAYFRELQNRTRK
jgi:hypothetical protein